MDSSHALTTTETFAGQAVELPWWRRTATKILNGPIISLGILAALVFVAVFADFLAPYPYNGTSRYTPEVGELRNKYLPPMWQARGKPQFILGTDQQGRDILSRLIYGSRISLSVALVSIGVSMLAGGALGLGAGLSGGAWDNIINRVMDVFFSIPGLLLAVGVAAMRGPGVQSAVLAIAIVYTPVFVRVMRGPVLAEREKDYVEAVRALGATRLAVALKHVLPNVLSPFVVQGTVAFSQAVLIEASLSYLGLSAQPPTPSWGNMLNEGRTYLETAPWISVFPGIAIMVTVLAFNLLGDGLRDVLDPNSQ